MTLSFAQSETEKATERSG